MLKRESGHLVSQKDNREGLSLNIHPKETNDVLIEHNKLFPLSASPYSLKVGILQRSECLFEGSPRQAIQVSLSYLCKASHWHPQPEKPVGAGAGVWASTSLDSQPLSEACLSSLSKDSYRRDRSFRSLLLSDQDYSVFKIVGRCWRARYGRIRFRLVDINCIAYLSLLAFLLIFFHKSVSKWMYYFLFHIVLILIIMEIARLEQRNPYKSSLRILRNFYSIAIILFGWKEIDALCPMFYGTYWSTEAVIRLDKFLFGVHPTVWVQKFYRPWLDELMYIFYFGYYLFLPIISSILFIKKKNEEILATFSIVTLTYFSNFFLFFIFPTLSPALADFLRGMHTQQNTGYIIAGITRLILAYGTVKGGSIPSSHVSGAFVLSFIAFRYQKKLGYVLFPLAFAVAFSSVYLGYHHAVDTILGIIWSIICYSVSLKIIKAREENPTIH